MSSLQEEFEKISNDRIAIVNEMVVLSSSEKGKKYFELRGLLDDLNARQEQLAKDMQREEYNNCNHIIIGTKIYPKFRDVYHGCVKCGLCDKCLNYDYDFPYLSFEDRVMANYLMDLDSEGKKFEGINVDAVCSLDFAHLLYLKIKLGNPDISDQEIAVILKQEIDKANNSIKDSSNPELVMQLAENY